VRGERERDGGERGTEEKGSGEREGERERGRREGEQSQGRRESDGKSELASEGERARTRVPARAPSCSSGPAHFPCKLPAAQHCRVHAIHATPTAPPRCTASPAWCAAAFQSVPSARRRVGKRLLYPGLCFGCLPRNCHQPWPMRRRSICRARRDAYNATRGDACSIQRGASRAAYNMGHGCAQVTRDSAGASRTWRVPRGRGGGLRTAAVLRGAFARETRRVSRAGASDEKTNECMLRRAACGALSRASHWARL
jgi:hypothetical protein